METKEIWRRVILDGKETDYEVSSFGRFKSLKYGKEVILKQSASQRGYLFVSLRVNGKYKIVYAHKAVAMMFLNHEPDGMNITINHIDGDKQNNRVSNIEEMSCRENTVDAFNRRGGNSSIYTGVYFNKSARKWQSQIVLDGEHTYLGLYDCEKEAGNAYKEALNNHLISGGKY